MRRCAFLLAAVLAWPAGTTTAQDGGPAATSRVTIQHLFELKTLNEVSLSPDGRLVAFVVEETSLDDNSIRSAVYVVDAAGGTARRLTNGGGRDSSPRWSPDGKWVAFVSDRPAAPPSERGPQIWVIAVDGGEARQVTRGLLGISDFDWAPDGTRLAVAGSLASNAGKERRLESDADVVRLGPFSRIYAAGVSHGEMTALGPASGHVADVAWAPDGRHIAFTEQATPSPDEYLSRSLQVLDVATGNVHSLLTGKHALIGPKYSPDGQHVALTVVADHAHEGRLEIVAVAGDRGTTLAGTQIYDDAIEYAWASDSSGVYFTDVRGVDTYISRLGLDNRVVSIFEQPGVSSCLSASNGHLAFAHETPTTPRDLFIAPAPASDTAARAGARPRGAGPAAPLVPRKLTDLNPQVRTLALGRTDVFRWKNPSDGLDLDGLLLLPPGYRSDRACPLLVVVHGGPPGQFNRSFALRRNSYPLQVFASNGYAVFMPNPRGSGGYGDSFRHAVFKDWGGRDYEDIGSGVDALVTRGIADRDRMGIMGWSYGGYMTAWTLTRTTRFKAASIGAGIVNICSHYGTTATPLAIDSYFGDRPCDTPGALADRSPISFVGRVATPVLLQHSIEDRTVRITQSEEWHTALRLHAVPVELVRYPRSGHVITEPRLLYDSLVRNLEWFERFVMRD